MFRHVIVAGIATAALAFAGFSAGAGTAVKLNGTVGPGSRSRS